MFQRHVPKDDNEADSLAILYLKKEGGYTCPVKYHGRDLIQTNGYLNFLIYRLWKSMFM